MNVQETYESIDGYGYSPSIDRDDLTIKELYVVAALPHGSGIDYNWYMDRRADGRLVMSNAYHGMNEHDGYVGSVDFSVTYEKDMADFRLVFHTNSTGRYWVTYWDLKDYLGTILEYARINAIDALGKA